MVKLSIIILTYNSSLYIKNCLLSIFNLYEKEFNIGEYELIILDNASTDNTVTVVKNFFANKFPKKSFLNTKAHSIKFKDNIIFKINDKNFGFAKGINIASSFANGDLLLFLNSDTVLMDKNINNIVEFMNKDQKIAISGGQILDSYGQKELSSGNFFNLLNIFFLALGFEDKLKFRFSPANECQVDFVSGGFMFVKKNIFNDLKGFDENFFMYVEDMDLCFRAYKKGFKVIFVPFSSIKHIGQGSSDRSFAVSNIYKGILYFYKKHNSRAEFFMVKLLLKLKALVLILTGKFLRRQYLLKAYEEAYKVCR